LGHADHPLLLACADVKIQGVSLQGEVYVIPLLNLTLCHRENLAAPIRNLFQLVEVVVSVTPGPHYPLAPIGYKDACLPEAVWKLPLLRPNTDHLAVHPVVRTQH
jgi:hypothetical protein